MVNLPEGLRELVAVMEAGRDGSRNGSPVDRVHLKPNSDYEYTPMSALGPNRTRRDCRNDVNDPLRHSRVTQPPVDVII
jgi:hypothetical protein